MPVMGGLELMEKLRQARETHELPLILMTDHETPKEKQSAQFLGVRLPSEAALQTRYSTSRQVGSQVRQRCPCGPVGSVWL
jgi:CheY-like chemotaxis protein